MELWVLYFCISIGLFLLSVAFKVAGKLRLTLPLAYLVFVGISPLSSYSPVYVFCLGWCLSSRQFGIGVSRIEKKNLMRRPRRTMLLGNFVKPGKWELPLRGLHSISTII